MKQSEATFSSHDFEQARQWRHDLHAHPELGFQEKRTSSLIAALLAEWGLNVRTGIAGTGVVGTLGDGSGPGLAFRADIDALPILEETGLPYASKHNGVMHACGHDGHTAMLLLAAKCLSNYPLKRGTLHFIFQPAEENEGGARVMVDQGLFDIAPSHAVFAIHNWPSLPVGTFCARDDTMMAAFAIFDILVKGRGGHAALPHLSSGVLSAASEIVSSLHQWPARNIDPLEPAVISATRLSAGSAWNVNPETAEIGGTARWFGQTIGSQIGSGIRSIAQHVAAMHNCEVEIKFEERYPATINSPAEALLSRRAAIEVGLSNSESSPSMASEDFSFMLQDRPGAYSWLGAARQGENPGLHSPRFDFNDEILSKGASYWVKLAQIYLSEAQ